MCGGTFSATHSCRCNLFSICYLSLQSWLDENLVWNPADYGGLVDLRLPPSAVWTPDIVLYNK